MPLLFFNKIDSTNDYVKENLPSFNENFSGVYSFNQTKGRGLRANSWIAPPDKNIALTFCLSENSINSSINVSFWTALVLRDFIEETISAKTLIKWPNDIVVNKKKVCGILIEKVKNTYIIGIGINVLEGDFENLPKASSLQAISLKKYDLTSLVNFLLVKLKDNLPLLDQDKKLFHLYNTHLFGKNKIMVFKINNSITNGIIQKVDENGLLNIMLENHIVEKFRIKEVEFLY